MLHSDRPGHPIEPITIHHLPVETLSRIFTLGCHEDPLPISPVELGTFRPFDTFRTQYRCNQRLPKLFPALVRQVCMGWNGIVTMAGNGHLWSTAVYFAVQKENERYNSQHERFMQTLQATGNTDFIVYLAWCVAEHEGTPSVDAKSLLDKDEAMLTIPEQSFIKFLRCLNEVRSQKTRISAVFLRTWSNLPLKCLSRLIEDKATWPRLELLSFRGDSTHPVCHTTNLTAVELSLVSKYFPEGREDAPIGTSRPSLRSISYNEISISLLHGQYLPLPPMASALHLRTPEDKVQSEVAWRLSREAMCSCPNLRSASILFPNGQTPFSPSSYETFYSTRLRYLQLQATTTFIHLIFSQLLFPNLRELELWWLHDDREHHPTAPLISLPDLHTISLRTSLSHVEADFFKHLSLPSLRTLVFDVLENTALPQKPFRIKVPQVCRFIVRVSSLIFIKLLFELDTSQTECLTIGYPRIVGSYVLPLPVKSRNIPAFPELSLLEVSYFPPDKVLDWIAKLFLPKLRVIRGATSQEILWIACVIPNEDDVGIKRVEELSILSGRRLISLCQGSDFLAIKKLGLRLLISPRRQLGIGIEELKELRKAPLGTVKCLYPRLETLVIDCGSASVEEVRRIVDEEELEKLLKFRKRQGCPLELLFESRGDMKVESWLCSSNVFV